MKTIHWIVDKDVDIMESNPQILEATQKLWENEVVAFPTETVYGLGANALSDEAVTKIFATKGRPADNPLIIHIAHLKQLEQLTTQISEQAMKLIDSFWPGPLTIIFNKKPGVVSSFVTAGLDTVAVRMPDHPLALGLIRSVSLPLAAPSANKSGKPSPTSAEHVLTDLSGLIAGVLDGGETGVGIESTVIDCTAEVPVILRPGGISREEIEEVIGEVKVDPALLGQEAIPKSPGMKYTHYAPAAPLFLVDGEPSWIQQLINEKRKQGLKVGMMAPAESASLYDADTVVTCGNRANLQSVAKSLYDSLRSFDQMEVDVIFSEIFPKMGVGVAIMNRLEKAAGHCWIKQNESS